MSPNGHSTIRQNRRSDEERKIIRENLRKVKDEIKERMNVHHPADLKIEELIHWADVVGKALETFDVKSSQLRKFFGLVMRIEEQLSSISDSSAFSNEDVIYLKAHLAYAVGRHDALRKIDFYQIMEPIIDKVRNGQEGSRDFEKLIRFFRSILAYHKYYGGGE